MNPQTAVNGGGVLGLVGGFCGAPGISFGNSGLKGVCGKGGKYGLASFSTGLVL